MPQTKKKKLDSDSCPRCGESADVIDSRPYKQHRRRRRQCQNKKCAMRFTTYEITQYEYSNFVRKNDEDAEIRFFLSAFKKMPKKQREKILSKLGK